MKFLLYIQFVRKCITVRLIVSRRIFGFGDDDDYDAGLRSTRTRAADDDDDDDDERVEKARRQPANRSVGVRRPTDHAPPVKPVGLFLSRRSSSSSSSSVVEAWGMLLV